MFLTSRKIHQRQDVLGKGANFFLFSPLEYICFFAKNIPFLVYKKVGQGIWVYGGRIKGDGTGTLELLKKKVSGVRAAEQQQTSTSSSSSTSSEEVMKAISARLHTCNLGPALPVGTCLKSSAPAEHNEKWSLHANSPLRVPPTSKSMQILNKYWTKWGENPKTCLVWLLRSRLASKKSSQIILIFPNMFYGDLSKTYRIRM